MTVLTVNKRLARSLGAAHTAAQVARGLGAWETPDMLPWEAWLERGWRESAEAAGTILLSRAQEQYVWERIITESPGANRLLSIAPAARAAMEAWQLAQDWMLPLDGEEWERSEDTQAFLAWQQAFRETCERERWLERARLGERVAGLLHGSVRLEGFDDLTPRQRNVLEALHVEPAAAPCPRGVARLAVFRDAAEEIAAAASWARALVDNGTAGPIAIVAPGLQAIRAQVDRVFSDVLHPGRPETAQKAFNISAAPALSEAPVIETALLALGLGARRMALTDAGRLLRSPFLRGAENEFAARARLDAALRRRGEIEVADSALPWRDAARGLPREAPASTWAAAFSELLDRAGWPRGRALNSAEFQAVESWRDMLSGFAALDLCAGPMSYAEALGRLRRMAADTPFQPESGTPAPVQILGALEAAGQRLEHLWVMGLHDEIWPAPARPNPFLPLALQRDGNLPHASSEAELDFARRITERLLRSAPEVVLSYPQREGDRDLRPSPLIAGFPAAAAPQRARTFLDAVRAAAALEPKTEALPAPLEAPTEVRGGTQVFQRQAACPFWAFAEFRLGAGALEEAEFGLRALDRGKLIHATLERVWKELGTQERLCAASEDSLAALVDESAGATIADYVSKRPLSFTPRFTELERGRIARLVIEWLEIEKQRAPFEVVETERERIVEIAGLRVKARIDRVDRLAAGGHAILDYKTGDIATSKWGGERPDEPQLPVYSVTSEDELAAICFAQIRAGEVGFKGIARREGVAPGAAALDPEDWQTQFTMWRQTLESLAADFLAGRADADPKNALACQRCGLTALCRARELGRSCPEPEEND